MRRWLRPLLGQSLRLGVAPDGLALVRTSIWPHERTRLLGEVRFAALGTNAIGRELDALLAEHMVAGWQLRVVLSDELVRLWQVTPPQGAARMADLEAASALRFQSLFGASPAGWAIRADWSATQPFLASAVPQDLLERLQLAAVSHGFRVGLGRPERLQVCGPAPQSWGSSAGRLKFACTFLEDEFDPLWPDSARLALAGRAA
jgi:hypothetical protein